MFARIKNRRQRLLPVTFLPVEKVFKPQAKVHMLKDVNGWADRGRKLKYHLGAGRDYLIDADVAAEFITKGYASGELPRAVSPDERAEWHAQQTVVTP